MKELSEEIQQIKKDMKAKKITQDKLAELSKLPIQTLRCIFTGVTKNPRVDTMKAIKEAVYGPGGFSDEELWHYSKQFGITEEKIRKLTPEKQKVLEELLEVLLNDQKNKK